ncbi:MAG TPA: YbaB/EbfC family nucleoid-associated protein [Bacillales bacterium]|nr:YbaB/EbfC family nucleoid-associated protein [Bacillales bacterium]
MKGNMNNMMRQMQKMQKQMAKTQEELKEEKVEGTAGGGMVTVVASGHKEILDVKINEEAVDPDDVDMLQDLVLAATNEALKKVDDLSNERLGKFTKGLNLPF